MINKPPLQTLIERMQAVAKLQAMPPAEQQAMLDVIEFMDRANSSLIRGMYLMEQVLNNMEMPPNVRVACLAASHQTMMSLWSGTMEFEEGVATLASGLQTVDVIADIRSRH